MWHSAVVYSQCGPVYGAEQDSSKVCIILYKVVLNVETVGEILKPDHSNESY